MSNKRIIDVSGKVIEGEFFLESYAEISKRIAPQYKYPFWALLDLGYIFSEGAGIHTKAECDVEPNLMQKEVLRKMNVSTVKNFMDWTYYSI
jgi:hypothetical protein